MTRRSELTTGEADAWLNRVRAACARLRNSPALCGCRDYGRAGLKPCRAAVAAADALAEMEPPG